jgi:hypothetical protein
MTSGSMDFKTYIALKTKLQITAQVWSTTHGRVTMKKACSPPEETRIVPTCLCAPTFLN